MKRVIVLIMALLLLTGCQEKPLICSPQIEKTKVDSRRVDNFILTVVSEDGNIKDGKLNMFIDDKLYNQVEFSTNSNKKIGIPNNYFNYSLKLSKGIHKIEVRSEDGADKTGAFQIGEGCHYGLISYGRTINGAYLEFKDSDHRYLFD